MEHVALEILWLVIPVCDASLSQEHLKVLKLFGPDRAVGPRGFEQRPIRRIRGNGRPPLAVIERVYGIRPAVPARVVVLLPSFWILRRVSICSVCEDVPGMMGDNVKNHLDPLLVRGFDESAKIFPRSEVRVDIKKVLDTVAVVGRLERDLAEGGAHPERGHSQAL